MELHLLEIHPIDKFKNSTVTFCIETKYLSELLVKLATLKIDFNIKVKKHDEYITKIKLSVKNSYVDLITSSLL